MADIGGETLEAMLYYLAVYDGILGDGYIADGERWPVAAMPSGLQGLEDGVSFVILCQVGVGEIIAPQAGRDAQRTVEEWLFGPYIPALPFSVGLIAAEGLEISACIFIQGFHAGGSSGYVDVDPGGVGL